MSKDTNLGRILVGRYRLRRVLGQGAHGRVYLAEDLGRGGEHVAFKLVEGLVGGNRREPADEVLRWLRHPNWANVRDSGDSGELDWFQVTRYVPGQSLDKLEGAQPLDLVAQFLEDGARALRALHQRGLIHYDVTPGNWILSRDGDRPQFVLTDGGLAHIGPIQGVARGTPQFMAPELTEGSDHDHRVDLYSLGLVAYRLATGRDPFEGGAGEILGMRRTQDAPRTVVHRPEVPAELDDLIADLLDRNPNARPHDATSLLERLDRILDREVAPYTHGEGIAAATGGRVAGRDEQRTRFLETARHLAARRPGQGGQSLANPAHPKMDAVLLLTGAPGSGTTRLAEEMVALSREEGLPVLLIAGREGTPDRRGPLRRLVDGMAHLELSDEASAEVIRLDLGSRRGFDREERAHAPQRAIEQFLRAVQNTSRRAPFALVVEDFRDLPPAAQEAIRVLSRFLLARREGAGGTATLPVTLVVDMGSEDVEPLLIPDSTEPHRPVVPLGALEPAELLEICEERFPGFQTDKADLQKVHRAAEGLPGVLVSLLGEAFRRGDLQHSTGRWHWNVDDLAAYEIDRALSPILAEALRNADTTQVQFLQYLALVDVALSITTAAEVLRRVNLGEIPSTPLLAIQARGAQTVYAIANRAVRTALVASLAAEQRTAMADELLVVIAGDKEPDLVADRARLLLLTGKPGEAVNCLASDWHRLTADQRRTAQPLIREAVHADPHLLKSERHQSLIPSMLEHGPDAIDVARTLSVQLKAPLAPSPSVRILAEALEGWHLPDEALQLVAKIDVGLTASLPERAAVHTQSARLYFALHNETSARLELEEARAILRQIPKTRDEHPRLLTEFLMVYAQASFLQGDPKRCVLALRGASIAAKSVRSPALRARILNNLGIAYNQHRRFDDGERSLARALRLKRILGDISGLINATYNLGRIHQTKGALVKSASLYQSSATVAQRHADFEALARSLRALGLVYDQQLNAPLALATLQKAAQAADRTSSGLRAALVASDAAPLAAAIGDLRSCGEMLLVSARGARSRRSGYARASFHLAALLTAVHLGDRRRIRLAMARALRHKEALYLSSQRMLDALVAVHRLSDEDGPGCVSMPPSVTRHGESRFQFKALVWLARSLKNPQALAGAPLTRFLPHGLGRASASGHDRRLLVEAAIAACRIVPGLEAQAALKTLERHLAHTGETALRARTVFMSSALAASREDVRLAQLFSRAVDMIGSFSPSTVRVLGDLPTEGTRAYHFHSSSLESLPLSTGLGLHNLHSLAHRLLLKTGGTAAPDNRLASALRRVLEATAKMNAGAGLDKLLEDMTKHTIEITDAQRACVVLADGDSRLDVRVATSASHGSRTVRLQDLSHTVISRVLASRTPLLLHDVFDDAELMGRPSITSLSLRSILCVPMVRGDTLYGVMYADNASAAGSFDQIDLEVMTLFAEQAGAALETTRLFADIQRSMEELRSMQERLVRGERLRVIGELSSGVAHEFNNLLTSILARVQLISLNHLGPELRNDLSLIEKACLDAAEVVRRLQSFSRRERQGNFVDLDAAEICNDAIEFLRPLWSARRRQGQNPIDVTLNAEKELRVRGDATELREVVTNLVKNALDAVQQGGQVSVSAYVRDGAVRISVRDDGVGVPEDVLSKVFDPFFTTKGERGTGLGLCLAQQIVERHGGQISIESLAGTGTVVDIALPTAGDSHQDSPDGEGPATEAICVLVVDDDENVRKPLCRFLEHAGYDVYAAADGAEALRSLEDQTPDVIISDIGMPGIDGLDLCRQLQEQSPEIPVVLMSGWASGGVDPARARQVGASALLAKPFAMQQVRDVLRELASKTHNGPATPPTR